MSELSPRLRAALAFAAAAAVYTLGFGAFAVARAGSSAPGTGPILALMGTVSAVAAAGVGAAAGPWFAARAGQVLAGALGGMVVSAVAYAVACVVLAGIAMRPGGFFGTSGAFGPGMAGVGPALVWLASHTFGVRFVLLPVLPLAALAGVRLVRPEPSSPAEPGAP